VSIDSNYWSRVQRDPPLVAVYLRRLELRSQLVAAELVVEARMHPSFRGWYLSQEIDHENWTKKAAWEALMREVTGLSATLHRLTPGAKVAISGFSNGRRDPERLAADWAQLTSRAAVDRLMFQDGVGAAKLQIADLEPYYAALQRALTGICRFAVVVETFEQQGGPPIDHGSFRAAPASFERLVRQMELAGKFSSAPLIAFSVPDYMTPEAGADAAELFDRYRAFIVPRE
jgi:hypothetical protein